jgi:hypothetical protein
MPRRKRDKQKEFRAVYSIPQLAALANVSRFVMGRLLEDAQVPMHRHGRRRVIFLFHIKRHLPGLWESIEEYGLS